MSKVAQLEITGEDIDVIFAEARRKHTVNEICVFAQKLVNMEPKRGRKSVDVWLYKNDMEVLLEQERIHIWQNEKQYSGSYIICVLFRGFNFFHAGTDPWWKEKFPPR